MKFLKINDNTLVPIEGITAVHRNSVNGMVTLYYGPEPYEVYGEYAVLIWNKLEMMS